MNRKSVSVIILLLLFIQCSKDKNEKPAPDLEKDLLAYFPLNGHFNDSTKNIQDVQYGGFLSFVKNRHGYNNRALHFGGGLFAFQTPFWAANPITVSLWIKPDDLVIESFLVYSQEEAFGVYQSKSKLGLSVRIPANGSALGDIKVEWTHYAGTYDGKDIKTYINGKLATTFHHAGTADVTTSIVVGAQLIPEWKGTIDDIRFYNRVLTAEEIKVLSEL